MELQPENIGKISEVFFSLKKLVCLFFTENYCMCFISSSLTVLYYVRILHLDSFVAICTYYNCCCLHIIKLLLFVTVDREQQ